MGWEGPMTHRQYQAWHQWLEEDFNNPGKLEAYLMQVAAEVRMGNSKEPSKVKIDDMKVIRKRHKVSQPTEEGRKLATTAAKMKWMGAFG